jgi:hypothetical protein
VKQRDQRSDIVTGAALESLLASYVSGVPLPAGMNGRFIMATRMGGILPMLQQHHHEHIASIRQRRSSRTHTLDNVLVDSSSDDDDAPGLFSNFMSLLSQRRDSRHSREELAGSSAATNSVGRSELHPLSFPFASVAAASIDGPAATVGIGSLSTSFSFRSSLAGSGTASQNSYRSYASNGSDPSAGQGASNPLEIDDSDSDDSVEVVQVVATATSSI